jgi:uncharacterized membrane protein YgcG
VAEIDPSNPEYDSKDSPYCTAGDRVLHAVGFLRGTSSAKGTPFLEVRLVCLEDLDAGDGEPGEVRKVVHAKFWLTEKALKFGIVAFARAIGYDKKFDPMVDEQIEDLLGTGPVVGTVEEETWTGDNGRKGTKAIVDAWAPHAGAWRDEWDAILDEANEEWPKYIAERERRAAEARSNPRQGSGSQRRSGGGGRRNGGGGGAASDDVPF